MQTQMVKVPTFNGQAEMSLDTFIEYQNKMCAAAQIANSVKNLFPNSSTVGQIEGRLLLAAPEPAQKTAQITFEDGKYAARFEGRLIAKSFSLQYVIDKIRNRDCARAIELGVTEVDTSLLGPDVGAGVNATFYRFDSAVVSRLITVFVDVDVSHKLAGVDLEICWDKANKKWMTPVLTKAFAEKMGLTSRSLAAYLFGSKYDHARRIDLGDGVDNFNFTRSNFHINAV